MEMELQGEIIKLTYDSVVNIEQIELRDSSHNFDIYIEIPRAIVSFEDSSKIKIVITDKMDQTEFDPNTKTVFNSILYMVRQNTKAQSDSYIIQFSSGGLLMRIITEKSKKSPFKIRGNRNFKLIIS